MAEQQGMKTPGAMLKQSRQAEGLSLADIATTTRISKTMLAHLENDDYNEYTAEVFLRGHLRNFAREVGLDPDEVIRSYEQYTGRSFRQSSEDTTTTRKRNKTGAANTSSSSSTSDSAVKGFIDKIRVPHMVGVALVLVGIFILVHFMTGQSATATNRAEFSTETQQEKEWEKEQKADKTRWLLEAKHDRQSDSDSK